MLPSTVIFASLSGLALAHGSTAHGHGPLGLRHLAFKRQLGGSGVGEFPESCAAQCKPYLDTGSKCAGLNGQGTSTPSQADIIKCACTTEFFGAFTNCLECAPQSFSDESSSMSLKQIVDAAIQQCAAAGSPVTGVDTSNLPDGAASGSGASSVASSASSSASGASIASSAIVGVTSASRSTPAGASGAISGATSAVGAAGSSVTSAANAAASSTVGGGNGAAAAGVTVHAGLVIAVLSVVAGSFVLLA